MQIFVDILTTGFKTQDKAACHLMVAKRGKNLIEQPSLWLCLVEWVGRCCRDGM